MKSISFKGRDGHTYAIPAPHSFETFHAIPALSPSATASDIVTHVMLIVASEPPYIKKSDTQWLLAFLNEFRKFVIQNDCRNYSMSYAHILKDVVDTIDVAKMMFAIDLVNNITNGFWVKKDHASEPVRIFVKNDYAVCRPFIDFDKSTKSWLTSRYFTDQIYECEVPAGESIYLSSPAGGMIESGETFLFLQPRFHASESRYDHGQTVKLGSLNADELVLGGFAIPGKILLKMDCGDYSTRNSLDIPVGWLKKSGRKIDLLKEPPVTASNNDDEPLDLMKDAEFAKSFENSLYQYEVSRAREYLLKTLELGATVASLDFMEENYNLVECAESAKSLMIIYQGRPKVSKKLITEHVLKCPLLLNTFPTQFRDFSLFKSRRLVDSIAWKVIALSNNNLQGNEAAEFYSLANNIYPYPYKMIPKHHQSKESLVEILPNVDKEDFDMINTNLITKIDLENYYGEDYLYDFRRTGALEALPHLFTNIDEDVSP